MRRFAAVFLLITLSTGIATFFASSLRPAAAQPPPTRPGGPGQGPGPGTPGGPPPGGWQALNQDSIAAERDSMTKEILDGLAGRGGTAAESVFRNIRVMKGLPAERLVQIMNGGYSRALGVSCRYCHIPGHWRDDDKSHKVVARDMILMTRAINDTLLPRVANPDNDHRVVNCNSCHHGHPNPNWEMRNRPPGPGGPEPGH